MKIYVFGLRGFPNVEGGVEKHCEQLYTNMSEKITIFRRKTYVKKYWDNTTPYNNIEFIDLPSTRIRGFETLFHSFLATIYCMKDRPNIVHIHNIGPALFSGLLKIRKIPIVLTYHSPNYEHSKWGFFAKKFLHICEYVALKNADKIIFVNSHQMKKFSNNIQRKSIYIPNGINKAPISSSVSFLSNLGLNKHKYILSVGRITPEKGFETLISAFIKAKHEGYKLVIAGGCEFEHNYMKKLRSISNEDVLFTGYVYGDKLAQLYTNARLFVLSSLNEGFPLVLLEAMSYKLDVLVSDIPACHLVSLDEDDYFPKCDSSILSKKIEERLYKTKKRSYDLNIFQWSNIANETMNIYINI